MNTPNGIVYLVGAGPGDPGLITWRGIQCLQQADLVLYDYLVNPRILDYARQSAETVCLGQHGHTRLASQDEINRQLIEGARAGKAVVRLKGGDPLIFARIGEELAALDEANVEFEIVPGVTAASAVASHAGIPLTARDHASCVALITGKESLAKEQPELDYGQLARFPGTLVFYMGVTSVEHWSTALISAGKSPRTPVAIVRRASWPSQETFACELGELTREVQSRALRPPAVFVVGEVARATVGRAWFTSRPLFGQQVLVTRPEHQAGALEDRIWALGGAALRQPAIQILPPQDWTAVDTALGRLTEFGWIVFSSSNGVDYFLKRLRTTGRDLRALGGIRVAAIGPATAAALEERGLGADLQPEEFRAEALAEALIASAAQGRVLLIRASRGREVLAESLSAAGMDVEQVIVYQSLDVQAPSSGLLDEMRSGQVHWTLVTSSAIARSLLHLFGDALRATQLAAISPITAEVLRSAGYPPTVVASEYTTEGLLEAIVAHVRSQAGQR